MFKYYLLVVAELALGPQLVKGQLVGGTNAQFGEFPYHVCLTADGEYFCSGALISRRHVLTAGHCVALGNRLPGLKTALLGNPSLNHIRDRYRLLHWVHHPQYVDERSSHLSHNGTDTIWLHDIGIYTMAADVRLSRVIDIVSLPTSEIVQPLTEAVVSAAGCKRKGGPNSRNLQKIVVRIIDLNTCQSMMSSQNHIIYESFICTLNGKGIGTCSGDSGGPLVQNDVLIGVVAGGIPCAKGFPDIYTRIHHYLPWIREVTGL